MKKPEVESKDPVDEAKCKHYWIIDSPNGPTSKGVCKYCGVENEFSNSAPFASWGDDTSSPTKPLYSSDFEPNNESQEPKTSKNK